MKIVGIVCNDIITRNNIINSLSKKGIKGLSIHSAGNFDPNIFDLLLIDLHSPIGFLILKNSPRKSIAFTSSENLTNISKAREFGCEKIYKYGEFFKEILPQFSFKNSWNNNL